MMTTTAQNDNTLDATGSDFLLIRPARQGDHIGIAKVHFESWVTTYTGLIPDKCFETYNLERRQERWKRHVERVTRESQAAQQALDEEGPSRSLYLYVVSKVSNAAKIIESEDDNVTSNNEDNVSAKKANDDGDKEEVILGFISGSRKNTPASFAGEAYDAEIDSLYIMESAQGKGLGLQLFLRCATELHTANCSKLFLWALVANKIGRNFYEKRGGVVIGEKREMMAGAELHDVAYGWNDLSQLVALRKAGMSTFAALEEEG